MGSQPPISGEQLGTLGDLVHELLFGAHCNSKAVPRAKDYLDPHAPGAVFSQGLEAVAGLNRWELARLFRRLLRTSPHRYLVMRRLDRARLALRAGAGLADAAAAGEFPISRILPAIQEDLRNDLGPMAGAQPPFLRAERRRQDLAHSGRQIDFTRT